MRRRFELLADERRSLWRDQLREVRAQVPKAVHLLLGEDLVVADGVAFAEDERGSDSLGRKSRIERDERGLGRGDGLEGFALVAQGRCDDREGAGVLLGQRPAGAEEALDVVHALRGDRQAAERVAQENGVGAVLTPAFAPARAPSARP